VGVTIGALVVADPPEAWEAAGFTVDPDATCRIGTVEIRLVGRTHGTGIVAWSLRDLPRGRPAGDIDGLPTTDSDGPAAMPAVHSNGVLSIDHVVVLSPDLSRTVAALAAIGLRPRRERNGDLGGRPMRQVFFRLGEVILEVVGSPNTVNEGPSTLWGLTHVVADVNATAALFGDRAGRVKPAIQPGRRITTLRHDEFGMSVHTALISSDPRFRT
jgi:hypothetical protein